MYARFLPELEEISLPSCLDIYYYSFPDDKLGIKILSENIYTHPILPLIRFPKSGLYTYSNWPKCVVQPPISTTGSEKVMGT